MSYVSEVLADSPLAYYRMNDASGLIQDSSGNARHATTSAGTATYGQASPITSDPAAKAIAFSGDDWFGIPDFDLTDPNIFSLEAWIKVTTGSRANMIMTKNIDGYAMWIDTTNTPVVEKFGVAFDTHSSVTVTADGNFHHLLMTKNGTTRAFYRDNSDVTVLDGSQTFINTTSTLRIGENFFGDFIMAHLAELAVYDSALTQARAEAHFNAATASGVAPSDDPPIGILGRGAGW